MKIMHILVSDTFEYLIKEELDKNPNNLKKILDNVSVEMKDYHSKTYRAFFEKEASRGNLEIIGDHPDRGEDEHPAYKLTKKTKDEFITYFQDYLDGNKFFKK